MNVSDIVGPLELKVMCPGVQLDAEVKGGYCSDLLSDVMANAEEGDVWITLHTHLNIVAVGMLSKVAAIVITGGRIPEQNVIDRAAQEGLPILCTHLSTFEIAGRLYQMLKQALPDYEEDVPSGPTKSQG